MKNTHLPLSFAAALFVALSASVSAQSTWTGAAGTWSSNANPGWNGTGVPNAIDATANIAAASGNITVNGPYTLGILTAGGSFNGRTLLSSAGNLTFDVGAGNALLDLSNGGLAGSGINVNSDLTLNDTLEIRNLVSAGSQTATIFGTIGGAGAISLTNTGTTGSGARYRLQGANSTFAGGVLVGQNTSLQIANTGALGSGTITRANGVAAATNSIDFRTEGSATQTHANNFDLGSNVSGSNTTLTLQNNTMNVTLNGVISGVMGSNNRANLNGGTLVLGGTSPNTWTGNFRSDTHGTIIADKVGALNIGFDMRSQVAGATTALLVGVTDTITGQIQFNGTNSGTGIAYIGQLGLKDGNNGTVTFNNANKINLGNVFGGVGGTDLAPVGASLNLHSGNGTGTLVVTTEIGQNTNARSISVTGSGKVNLNRGGGNTYTGTTTVSGGGTLLASNVTGSATGTGAVTVTAGTMGGIGISTGTVTIGNGAGGLDSFIAAGAPGSEIESLQTGALSLLSDATFSFQIDSTLDTADQLISNGVSLDAASVFAFSDLGAGAFSGLSITAINNTSGSAIAGTFSNVVEGGTVFIGANQFTASYVGGTGNDFVLTTVPEPSSLLMLMAGAGAFVIFRRRNVA